jgi:hypothetical protein
MKKLVVLVLSLLVVLSQSLASTTLKATHSESRKVSDWKTRIVTKSVLVRAVSRSNRRLLIINNLEDDNNDDPPGPDELDLQSPYARPRLVKPTKDIQSDDELSDYVVVRLAVARAKAMKRYRELWT